MNGQSEQRRQREAAIIDRMALARAQLLAANLELRATRARKKRMSDKALTISNLGRALLDAPTVTLFASILLGSLIVGPKRIAPVVMRAGVTGWVARSVRTFVGR
ncbi:hypothetical protein LMG27952_06133 [Paraburkholderia hiiakae]|uniref:YqjK-like protein n=1 Tax=Paraburkholderia hiiakae TaxID=1081782 RepID=A0ABN7IET6_9BURK|nr:hypothetical protein [Paraburkholderia hiiakae]CAD6556541.1 hypothetical protein LMG27952_06133 [Paraburkholderia hiiakae]